MTLEGRMQALLDLVEEDRRTRCGAIDGEAQARTRVLLAQAHADARVRMREAFAEERERADARRSAAQAKLATRRRIHAQQHAALLLAQGLARLPDALQRRWSDPPARAAWVDAVVADALAALPRTAWRITHPVDWPVAERQALAARLAASLPTPPALAGDPAFAEGLKISVQGSSIDGTLAGVVADRTAVGSRLLGLLGDEARRAAPRANTGARSAKGVQ